LTSQDEEKQTDISALLKKIRGACTSEEKPTAPATPTPEETAGQEEEDSPKTGDFSELIKKTGSRVSGGGSGESAGETGCAGRERSPGF